MIGIGTTEQSLTIRKCCICQKGFELKSNSHRFCSKKCAKKEIEFREKWNDASVKSSELPNDSLFSDEIQNFFKKGGLITKYINPVWVAGSQISQYEENFTD
jgi:endogenous inhibitor of DNA gyrase (YacG/DUF329 family)